MFDLKKPNNQVRYRVKNRVVSFDPKKKIFKWINVCEVLNWQGRFFQVNQVDPQTRFRSCSSKICWPISNWRVEFELTSLLLYLDLNLTHQPIIHPIATLGIRAKLSKYIYSPYLITITWPAVYWIVLSVINNRSTMSFGLSMNIHRVIMR